MRSKWLLCITLFVISCAPSVNVQMDRHDRQAAFPLGTPFEVLNMFDNVPGDWVRIGEASFGDNGLTVNCGYYTMLELAKRNGLANGANALKIVEHKTPDLLSSCDRIRVVYYRRTVVETQPVVTQPENPASPAANAPNPVSMAADPAKGAKNTTAIGYQLGGNTLIGIDFENRVSSQFGIHFGGGLAGFGGGIRLHFGPETHSSFWDVNFKDAGFGLFQSIAFEYGGLLKLNEDSGIRYLIGVQKTLSIDKEFERKVFKNKKAPPYLLSFGLGWCW